MASFALAKLVNRKLIKIIGPDCYPYLQSLFCNDLRLLYEPDRLKSREHARVSPNVLSSFMLNAQGRVICDILVYRTPNTRYECEFKPPGIAKEPDELLIECDSSLASGLANTLYGYRVRRKVSLEILQNQSVWCLYPKLSDVKRSATTDASTTKVTESSSALANTKEIINNELSLVNDPRLEMMGMRVLDHDDSTNNREESQFMRLKKILQSQVDVDIHRSTVKDYIMHRYQLGVSEGPNDHPEGGCLPLECNADLLGSVSFDKGCYLGQELTARIHFTGVVRKRLMPIIVNSGTKQSDLAPLTQGQDIVDEDSGKKLGAIRYIIRDHGLALLRQDLITETTGLVHEATKIRISTWKPFWWQHNH